MDPQLVKKLRDMTGAGFADCKKALEETGGDLDQAVRRLKEMGVASAAKRAGREAKEGRVFAAVGAKGAAFVVLGCETDFVARNDSFVNFGKKLAQEMADRGSTELTAAQQEELVQLGAVIKENIHFKKALFLPVAADQAVAIYVHGEEGRKGSWAIAQIEGKNPSDPQIGPALKEFALHAVAYDPPYFSEADVPASYIEEQRQIFLTQAKGLGKPEAALGKIVEGKLQKHFSEIVYLKQPWINDAKITVEQAAAQTAKQLGCGFRLVSAGCVTVGG